MSIPTIRAWSPVAGASWSTLSKRSSIGQQRAPHRHSRRWSRLGGRRVSSRRLGQPSHHRYNAGSSWQSPHTRLGWLICCSWVSSFTSFNPYSHEVLGDNWGGGGEFVYYLAALHAGPHPQTHMSNAVVNQSRAVCALVIVSSVVKVFEEMVKKVSAAARS